MADLSPPCPAPFLVRGERLEGGFACKTPHSSAFLAGGDVYLQNRMSSTFLVSVIVFGWSYCSWLKYEDGQPPPPNEHGNPPPPMIGAVHLVLLKQPSSWGIHTVPPTGVPLFPLLADLNITLLPISGELPFIKLMF